jgi:hypothetical protein
MSEPFDSKYKLFKQIGVPHSGMSVENSHLTIREDLVADGLSVPVYFLDYKEDTHVEQTDTLNIDCIFSTDGEELHEGMGIIVRITDPTRKDKYGEPWKERMAFAYSIDFDWN